MRIAIYGTGCIGSLVGCALQSAGRDVTFVDLPQRAARIRRHGIVLRRPDGTSSEFNDLTVIDNSVKGTVHDLVILALKAHQIPAALPSILHFIGPQTIVVTTQNGIPWWYFEHLGGPYDSRTVEASDPGGRIRASIDSRQVVGCIAYPAVAMQPDGEVHQVEGNRLPVGPVAPRSVQAAETVAKLFIEAGFKSPVLTDIRDETWLKAIGNMSLNPISALTHATLVDICEHQDTRALVRQLMEEGEAVANSLGARLRVSIDRRIEGAQRVGRHRSSMLQDVENGEQMEVEALVAAVAELGALTGVPTPNIRAVLALTRLLNESVGKGPYRIARSAAGA